MFSSARLSLLDRGVAFAIAHIRGGGELGKRWHDDGRMLCKRNTFTDFIAAAEFLIKRGDTRPDRLVIEGGSAGGLLMGAVLNMRPDLFRAAVLRVPFVDVINTMLDESLPLTVGEFEEWGNPKILEEYEYIKSYCPYTNLAAKAYPAMLVRTSLNDSQVMYWEPAKYVAKLRTLKTDARPLLFKINLDAGHGGASGRYDHLREIAFDYAFVLTQLGLAATYPSPLRVLTTRAHAGVPEAIASAAAARTRSSSGSNRASRVVAPSSRPSRPSASNRRTSAVAAGAPSTWRLPLSACAARISAAGSAAATASRTAWIWPGLSARKMSSRVPSSSRSPPAEARAAPWSSAEPHASPGPGASPAKRARTAASWSRRMGLDR